MFVLGLFVGIFGMMFFATWWYEHRGYIVYPPNKDQYWIEYDPDCRNYTLFILRDSKKSWNDTPRVKYHTLCNCETIEDALAAMSEHKEKEAETFRRNKQLKELNNRI